MSAWLNAFMHIIYNSVYKLYIKSNRFRGNMDHLNNKMSNRSIVFVYLYVDCRFVDVKCTFMYNVYVCVIRILIKRLKHGDKRRPMLTTKQNLLLFINIRNERLCNYCTTDISACTYYNQQTMSVV